MTPPSLSVFTVYVAAPFAAAEGLSVEDNVARAVALGALATAEGYAPLVVHPAVEAGVYGSDDVPADRANGLRCTQGLAELVGSGAGQLWILVRPSGRLSFGCEAEKEAFLYGLRRVREGALLDDHIHLFRWESGKPVRIAPERAERDRLREEERGTPQA